jgi:hypothetical protein
VTEPLTRGEFAMLAARVDENARRLDAIDTSGTRGVGVLQMQITDLAKDFAAHEQKHEQAESKRVTGRRWAIGAAIAAVASMCAVLALLADIASHLRLGEVIPGIDPGGQPPV